MKILREVGQFKLNEGDLMANGMYNVTNSILVEHTKDEGVSYWFDGETKDLLMRCSDDEFVSRAKQLAGNNISDCLPYLKAKLNEAKETGISSYIDECARDLDNYFERKHLMTNLVTDANILSVELQLPNFTNVIDMNFDMGLLELECGGRKFVTDSFNSNYDSFNMSVEVTFKVDDDVCSDYKQDLLITDLFSDDLSVDFYIGCEYTIEPEVKSLFVCDNGSTKVIEFD